jgi:hypothetical protein
VQRLARRLVAWLADVRLPAAQPRRKKDRNAPKRPRNAYLVFLDRHRPAKQAANPTAAMKARGAVASSRLHSADARAPQDLTREMAVEWKTVSDEERKICDDLAAANKANYEVALKAYQAQVRAAAGAQAAADAGDEVRTRAVLGAFMLADCLARSACELSRRWRVRRAQRTTQQPDIHQTNDANATATRQLVGRGTFCHIIVVVQRPSVRRRTTVSSPRRAPPHPCAIHTTPLGSSSPSCSADSCSTPIEVCTYNLV